MPPRSNAACYPFPPRRPLIRANLSLSYSSHTLSGFIVSGSSRSWSSNTRSRRHTAALHTWQLQLAPESLRCSFDLSKDVDLHGRNAIQNRWCPRQTRRVYASPRCPFIATCSSHRNQPAHSTWSLSHFSADAQNLHREIPGSTAGTLVQTDMRLSGLEGPNHCVASCDQSSPRLEHSVSHVVISIHLRPLHTWMVLGLLRGD